MNDYNKNVEEPKNNVDKYIHRVDLEELNVSSVIDDALLDQIANEYGVLPNVDILPGGFPGGSSEASIERRRVSLTSSFGSLCTAIFIFIRYIDIG